MKEYTLKSEDIAKIFNVSLQTVRNWFEKKGLPGIKLAGVLRFNEEDVEEWINKQNKRKD